MEMLMGKDALNYFSRGVLQSQLSSKARSVVHLLSGIMGQKQSKRVSNTSSASLLTKHASLPPSPSTPLSPYGDITPPAAPRELTRISEIIDPRDLLQDEIYNVTPIRHKSTSQYVNMPLSPATSIVHSPSGNALGAEEFISHPNRPLAIWERQERVVQATRDGVARFEAESRMGNRSRMGTRSRLESRGNCVGGGKGLSEKKRCCGCWPF